MIDQGKDPEVQLVEDGAKKAPALLLKLLKLGYSAIKLAYQEIQKRRGKEGKNAKAIEAKGSQKVESPSKVSRGQQLNKLIAHARIESARETAKQQQKQQQLGKTQTHASVMNRVSTAGHVK